MMMLYIAVIIRWRGAKRVSPKALEHKKNQIFENYITGGKQRNAVLVFLITCVTFYLGTTFTRQVDFFYNFAVTELNAIINMCSYWHNHVFLNRARLADCKKVSPFYSIWYYGTALSESFCQSVGFPAIFYSIMTIIATSLATERNFCIKHSVYAGIFYIFFVCGYVSA